MAFRVYYGVWRLETLAPFTCPTITGFRCCHCVPGEFGTARMEWLFAVVAEKRSEISPDGLLALVTAMFGVLGGGDGACRECKCMRVARNAGAC